MVAPAVSASATPVPDHRPHEALLLEEIAVGRVEVSGETSIRIARGLSFEVSASVSRIRDQITLPRRDATEEEILLRLRELQSGYSIYTSFGISYSFGSLFNNIVNPRFR